MTTNGIEVDDTSENEDRDLIAESGRIARGELEGYNGVKCAAYVRVLVDELGGALQTFLDDHDREIKAGRTSANDPAYIEHVRNLLERLENSPT